MTILDSHLHLGDCRVFNLNDPEDAVIKAMNKYGVEKAILQPYPGAENEEDVHNRIFELTKKYPGKFYGLASVNPHLHTRETYKAKIRHYIEDFGFVGVKLHTIGHALNPLTPDGQLVAETAAELNVTLNVHTGPGVPFSLPSFIIPTAKKYPDMKIVLAHSGAGILTGEAYVVATQCPNVFLELSWCSEDDASWLVNDLGSERIMYGSDSLKNIPTAIQIFKSLELSDNDYNNVFQNTALKAFGIK